MSAIVLRSAEATYRSRRSCWRLWMGFRQSAFAWSFCGGCARERSSIAPSYSRLRFCAALGVQRLTSVAFHATIKGCLAGLRPEPENFLATFRRLELMITA